MSKKFAIIDLGSNSVRMIIVKIYGNGIYKLIEEVKEMVRLSEKMGEERILKQEPIDRTIYALKLFKSLIRAHKANETFCIATGAVRSAKNQKEFLQKVKEETGFIFDVISGESEGYYDYLGVMNTIHVSDCIIIDIGGASTELVWVENRKLKEVVSIPFGAVLLTEKFIGKNKYNLEKLEKLEKFMLNKLENISWLKKVNYLPIVGVGGSIRTLAKVHRKKIHFPIQKIHNYQMNHEEVTSIYNMVTTCKPKDRRNIPGIKKERADIIVGGLAPAKVLMDYIKAKELIISGNGLREGVFFKNYLSNRGYKENVVEDVLKSRVENIMKRYDTNMEHSYQVQRLALCLFDEIKEIHKLGDWERKLLAVSALLHDIGVYVDYYNHHQHGFYLVLNSRIYGLTNKELLICAFLVGMHRNIEFKGNWKEYHKLLDKKDYEKIKKLSLFLRMSEMLDRNEYGSVKDLKCHITEDRVKILLKTDKKVELEVSAAMKSEKDFQKCFKKEMCIIQEA
ncbi:MAG: exopolyphosphatase [Marinisporobacter sp.]|jgi:exopolyphosphatase/guanosine-5'-triphosphate,3'-diphosphate pyrophosphatase|nr:exopolyphosphatase [Marinisporobacter sp.]